MTTAAAALFILSVAAVIVTNHARGGTLSLLLNRPLLLHGLLNGPHRDHTDLVEAEQALVHLNVDKSVLVQCCNSPGDLFNTRTERADLADLVLLERLLC